MNKDFLDQLSTIYDALCQVETKGENTIILGSCLQAIQSLWNEMKKEYEAKSSEEE